MVLGTFSLDVRLHARVRPGDSLTVLYSNRMRDVDPAASAEILYLALDGRRRRAALPTAFKTKETDVDYYDEERSAPGRQVPP